MLFLLLSCSYFCRVLQRNRQRFEEMGRVHFFHFTFVLLLAILCPVDANWLLQDMHQDVIPGSFDCTMRKAAYDFGRKLIPRLGNFETLYYALDLNNPNCTVKLETRTDSTQKIQSDYRFDTTPDYAVFVSPRGCDESGVGTRGAPLKSVQTAIDVAIKLTPPNENPIVILREGTFYLPKSIELNAGHSGLRLLGYPNESPILSGGIELKVWILPLLPHDCNNALLRLPGSRLGLLLAGRISMWPTLGVR